MSTITNILDHYFDPVTPMFTREMAEAVINQRPDPHIVARIAELGRKADDGSLSAEERDEYQSLVDAGDVVSLVKSKARRFLDEHPG
jgi:hypothetical protein